MRVAGLNIWAILGAAIAVYLVGMLINGVLIAPETWMAASGLTKEDMDRVGLSRLPYSPVMPIVTVIGMAILFKWANVSGAANGVKWALLIACLSALPAMWYGWVYGVGPIAGTLIDSAHLLTGHAVAGAILARGR